MKCREQGEMDEGVLLRNFFLTCVMARGGGRGI